MFAVQFFVNSFSYRLFAEANYNNSGFCSHSTFKACFTLTVTIIPNHSAKYVSSKLHYSIQFHSQRVQRVHSNRGGARCAPAKSSLSLWSVLALLWTNMAACCLSCGLKTNILSSVQPELRVDHRSKLFSDSVCSTTSLDVWRHRHSCMLPTCQGVFKVFWLVQRYLNSHWSCFGNKEIRGTFELGDARSICA